MKKVVYKDIFALEEFIKVFMKTKENGENIYKMLIAWLRDCRSTLAFRGNKEYKKRDRKENAWRAVEQFVIAFL